MAINNFEIKRTNPNAMIFIYNYRDRLGDARSGELIPPFDVDRIILGTTSLLNITTSKNKSTPAGTFEFRLAPTRNWVSAITPGSWCIILMSNSEIDDKAKYGGGRVDEKSFKMLGRIESVRGVIEVDQVTGARKTQYVVQGADWGTIFNSRFYVDPVNRSGEELAVGTAERFGFEEYLLKAVGYEPTKIGKKANETPPNTKRPKTEASIKPVEQTNDFLNNGGFLDPRIPLGLQVAGAAVVEETPSDFLDPRIPLGLQRETDTQTVIDEENPPEFIGPPAPPIAPKDQTIKLPSAADSVAAILKLWGRSDPATSQMSKDTGLLAKSQQQFRIPDRAAEYMQFKDTKGKVSNVISQVLTQITGKLIGQDKYSNVDRSAGIINFDTIIGDHSIWQVLNDNNNAPINELIPEIRFEDKETVLALYNRVRPFTVKEDVVILGDNKKVGDGIRVKKNESIARFFLSKFRLVKTKMIDINDVINCNFGTNWRDKYNFIEVNIDRSLFKETFAKDIKLESQFKDEDSIGRDGLQPMMTSFTYVPQGPDGIQNVLGVFVYKYALKEWHFNTHKMLNGNMQLIGQDQYIQVGDNIRVKAEVLGLSKNISAVQKATRIETYVTAHVESITHTAQVDPNGARSFVTNINFVRGIITDVNGNIVAATAIDKHIGKRVTTNAGAVDQDARKLTASAEKNQGTVSTSGSKDPDRRKFKGK